MPRAGLKPRFPPRFTASRRLQLAPADRGEPSHVHVEYEGRVAKFWLSPIAVAKTGRLSEHQLRQVERLVTANRLEFIEAWNDFFGA